MDALQDQPHFRVVVNDEGRHSIWPANRTDPPGWRDTGFRGDEARCAEHITESWPDIRPTTLAEDSAERS